MNDQKFIKETFILAKKGEGWTNPNPMVGAIIARGGKIIGRGYHKGAGKPHAEIEALKSAKADMRGATLFVNLEPCATWGKTPPCVDEIIRSGIKRVVISALDPNPDNLGRGFALLKKTGIDITVGILESEAKELNEQFFTFHEKKRPYIALKFAASLDGKMATKTGDSKWITNEESREYARQLRGKYQAILVGINTILKDDPHLGVRDKTLKDPLRIILGDRTKIPEKSHIFRDPNVLFLSKKNAQITIPELLEELYKRNIVSVLVEGGEKVHRSFIDTKIFDKLYAFYAPILIGNNETINTSMRLKPIDFRHFDNNFLVTLKVKSGD